MSYTKLLNDEIHSLRLKLSLQTSLKEFLKKELTATDAKVVDLKSENLAMSRSLVNCQEEIIKLIEENAALKKELAAAVADDLYSQFLNVIQQRNQYKDDLRKMNECLNAKDVYISELINKTLPPCSK